MSEKQKYTVFCDLHSAEIYYTSEARRAPEYQTLNGLIEYAIDCGFNLVAWAPEVPEAYGGTKSAAQILSASLSAGRIIEKVNGVYVARGVGETKQHAYTPEELAWILWGKRPAPKPAAVDPNAAMIARDGPARPKPAAVPAAPISTAKPALAALSLCADLEPRGYVRAWPMRLPSSPYQSGDSKRRERAGLPSTGGFSDAPTASPRAKGGACLQAGRGGWVHQKGRVVHRRHGLLVFSRANWLGNWLDGEFSLSEAPRLDQREFPLLGRLDAPSAVPNQWIRACKTYRQAVRTAWTLRRVHAMTRQQLATEAELTPQHVSDYLADDDRPGRRDLPADKVAHFEAVVGNTLVSQWLAAQSRLTVLEELQATKVAA